MHAVGKGELGRAWGSCGWRWPGIPLLICSCWVALRAVSAMLITTVCLLQGLGHTAAASGVAPPWWPWTCRLQGSRAPCGNAGRKPRTLGLDACSDGLTAAALRRCSLMCSVRGPTTASGSLCASQNARAASSGKSPCRSSILPLLPPPISTVVMSTMGRGSSIPPAKMARQLLPKARACTPALAF
jgi:hypothetical protein